MALYSQFQTLKKFIFRRSRSRLWKAECRGLIRNPDEGSQRHRRSSERLNMSHRSSVELLEYARLTLQLIERYPHAKKTFTWQETLSLPLSVISTNLSWRPLCHSNRCRPSGLLSQLHVILLISAVSNLDMHSWLMQWGCAWGKKGRVYQRMTLNRPAFSVTPVSPKLFLGSLADAERLANANPYQIQTVITLCEARLKQRVRGVRYIEFPVRDAQPIPRFAQCNFRSDLSGSCRRCDPVHCYRGRLPWWPPFLIKLVRRDLRKRLVLSASCGRRLRRIRI